MVLFPCFAAQFECAYTEDQIERSIIDFVQKNSKFFAMQKIQEQSTVLALRVLPQDLFFHNSFVPDVYIELSTLQHGCLLNFKFALKKSVKLLFAIFLSFLIAFEIILVIMVLLGRLGISPVIFLPFFMIFFMSMLSIVGLKLSSHQILQVITAALPQELTSYHHLKMRYTTTSIRSRK